MSPIWRLASYTNLVFFPDLHGDMHLLNLITDNLMQYNLLIHWTDTYFQMLSQQVSSLNCVKWLPWKCKTNWSKCVEMWDAFCIQLFAYILYEVCMQIVYTVLWWCTCKSELMYTKCTQNLYKMYAKFQQTFVHLLYAKPVTYSGCLGDRYTGLGAQTFCTQKTLFLFPVALQQKIHGSSNPWFQVLTKKKRQKN